MNILKRILRIILFSILGIFLFIVLLILSLIRPDIPLEKLLPDYTYETSSFLETDGMNVHFRDDGSGPAILLIHGTFASLHTWHAWTSELSKEYRVISIDLPGFGLTGPHPDNDYSSRATLYMLEELRNHLSIHSWAVAGNSLGARIALDYGLHYPERVSAIIALNGSSGAVLRQETQESPAPRETSAAPAQRQSLLWRILGNESLRNFMGILTPKFAFRYSLKEVYYDEGRIGPGTVDRYYKMLRREGNRKAFLNRGQQPVTDRSHIPELPTPTALQESGIPVLILWGEHDRWVPVQAGHRLHRAIPGSTLIVYEDAGHVPMEEIPQRSVRDAMDFLKHPHPATDGEDGATP